MNPDWQTQGTLDRIKKRSGETFLSEPGWYVTATDTLLLTKEKDREYYYLACWNRLGIKDELEDLLSLSTIKV